jgi:hypothetical protein
MDGRDKQFVWRQARLRLSPVNQVLNKVAIPISAKSKSKRHAKPIAYVIMLPIALLCIIFCMDWPSFSCTLPNTRSLNIRLFLPPQ